MIPQKDLEQLIQYYKGELSENALLNKAATLASKETSVVSRPPTPSCPGQCQNQTVESRITTLTKRIHQFPGGAGVGAPGGPPGEGEDEGDLVTGPV